MSDVVEDKLRLLELKQDQWYRRCRNSFVNYCEEALEPSGVTPAKHHRIIAAKLEAVAKGLIKRLLILAPPGSAKTTYTSRLFPSWYFAYRPRSSILAASHTQGLSELNSGHVQRYVRDNEALLGYHLIKDASDVGSTTTGSVSKERRFTNSNCAFRAGSVGAAILGFRANVAIIDDPVASRADAESATVREATWQWFVNDLLTRLTPDGAIVMIMTPFHEDDLAGRLLRVQAGEWDVLRLPAICDDELTDPLGRAIGEPLWSDDDYGYGHRLLEIRDAAEREGRARDWHAQYQGRPRPPDGAMFKPDKMPIVEPSMVPEVWERVRAWDLASSSGRGDYTVGLLLGRVVGPSMSESFVVLDVVRFRGAPEEVRATVLSVAAADGLAVKVWIPQDPAQAGADQVDSYVRMLTGYRVEAERMSGDKATRADAAASQANIGRIALVRAPWNAAFIEEVAAFPLGVHDDQVDALSLAFGKLAKPDLSVWARL